MTNPLPDDVWAKLAEPFAEHEVRWKPQAVKNNRAMAICYIDARAAMDRLDDVLGPGNWQDQYEVIGNHQVKCTLSIRVGAEWIVKSDVGGESEQPDEGDRMKAAFSDSLKRAAVKVGIARYLYRMPHQWVDYDPVKKQFTNPPKLPLWARPTPKPVGRPRVDAQPAGRSAGDQPPPLKVAAEPATNQAGIDFLDTLQKTDAAWAAKGVCEAGAVVSAVTTAGTLGGWGADVRAWGADAVEVGRAEIDALKARLKAKANGNGKPAATPKPDPKPVPAPAAKLPPPQDAAELFERLRAKDDELANLGVCRAGELLHQFEGQTQMFPSDLWDWTAEQVQDAYKTAGQIIKAIQGRPLASK